MSVAAVHMCGLLAENFLQGHYDTLLPMLVLLFLPSALHVQQTQGLCPTRLAFNFFGFDLFNFYTILQGNIAYRPQGLNRDCKASVEPYVWLCHLREAIQIAPKRKGLWRSVVYNYSTNQQRKKKRNIPHVID